MPHARVSRFTGLCGGQGSDRREEEEGCRCVLAQDPALHAGPYSPPAGESRAGKMPAARADRNSSGSAGVLTRLFSVGVSPLLGGGRPARPFCIRYSVFDVPPAPVSCFLPPRGAAGVWNGEWRLKNGNPVTHSRECLRSCEIGPPFSTLNSLWQACRPERRPERMPARPRSRCLRC